MENIATQTYEEVNLQYSPSRWCKRISPDLVVDHYRDVVLTGLVLCSYKQAWHWHDFCSRNAPQQACQLTRAILVKVTHGPCDTCTTNGLTHGTQFYVPITVTSIREELVTVRVRVRGDAGSACQVVPTVSKCSRRGTHWHPRHSMVAPCS